MVVVQARIATLVCSGEVMAAISSLSPAGASYRTNCLVLYEIHNYKHKQYMCDGNNFLD